MNNPWFLRQVKTALNSLYDPSVLRNSPLAVLLGPGAHGDPVAGLRRALIDAIESLQPAAGTPRGSKTWRVYQLLRRRYIEQSGQREVASDLGLSTRQLQREELLARQVLADHLWAANHLDERQHLIPASAGADEPPVEDENAPTRDQELLWLKESVPVQAVDVDQVLADVLGVLAPLVQSLHVSVEHTAPADLPRVLVQAPILRQALLDLVGHAVQSAPGGVVRITSETQPRGVGLLVRAQDGPHLADGSRTASGHENMEMARELVELCGGTIEIESARSGGAAFSVRVTLPATEQQQPAVLVIDDNADALQLVQRYLSNSRYRFVGAQDARRGLALAEELSPRAIVLDVMMPDRDGWAVLGQLREHPRTHHIPVIICSILAQEQLALTLGAAQFLRKPVTRQSLLSALDRQIDLAEKKSG